MGESQRKTTKQFKEEVFNLVKDEYTIIGEYINATTKLLVRHNSNSCDNYEYKVSPSVFLKGCRCPKCSREKSKKALSSHTKKNIDDFKQEVFNLVGDEYRVVGEYKNANTKIKMMHNSENCDKFIYEVTPKNFLVGGRCPICVREKYKKTNKEFLREVFDIWGDEYTPIEEYKDLHTRIKIRHNSSKCNHSIFEATPKNLLVSKTGCPRCNASKGEFFIKKFLEEHKLLFKQEYSFEDCRYKNKLYFDFALFDKNDNLLGLIEYDGLQHFKQVDFFGGEESFKKANIRDSIKNEYCLKNNIKLFRIKYTDFNNLDEVLEKILIKNNILKQKEEL